MQYPNLSKVIYAAAIAVLPCCVWAHCENLRHFTYKGEEVTGQNLRGWYEANNNLINYSEPRNWQFWEFRGGTTESTRLSPAAICFWDVFATRLERGRFTVGANLYLSSVYSASNLSVSPDPVLSMKYARGAADRGDTFAMILMALGHVQGYGLPKDFAAADQWLKVAMKQGSPLAREIRSDVYLQYGEITPKKQKIAFDTYVAALDMVDPGNFGYEYRHALTDVYGQFPGILNRDRVKEKLKRLPGGVAYVAKIEAEARTLAEVEAKAQVAREKALVDADDWQRREAYQRCEQRVADRYSRGHMNMELCQY